VDPSSLVISDFFLLPHQRPGMPRCALQLCVFKGPGSLSSQDQVDHWDEFRKFNQAMPTTCQRCHEPRVLPSLVLVWPSNSGSGHLHESTAVRPSRMFSPARLDRPSLRLPRFFWQMLKVRVSTVLRPSIWACPHDGPDVVAKRGCCRSSIGPAPLAGRFQPNAVLLFVDEMMSGWRDPSPRIDVGHIIRECRLRNDRSPSWASPSGLRAAAPFRARKDDPHPAVAGRPARAAS